MRSVRTLCVVLGDQLDLDSSVFDEFDPKQDVVWMAEVAEESSHVWSGKARIALFLSAMRHFASALTARGRPLRYVRLDDPGNAGSLQAQLQADLIRMAPARVVMTAPGDWRVLQAIKSTCASRGVSLEVRDDRHFYVTVREFAAYARRRQSLRMEYFYREQRRRHQVLMRGDGKTAKPIGGQWNFDADNRDTFTGSGPGIAPQPPRFLPDATTRDVIALVENRFADHPGQLSNFGWPVTREQALQALQAFISLRLPLFGRYQDAMWPGDPWLYHSHLSAALNLKLLNPREVVAAAERAYHDGHAPLASVEGFVRQILGWREYVRGIYWTRMPDYADSNALGATHDLPRWYWTGDTHMSCLRDALRQTIDHGYANHIQRLMITGLYAMLLGVKPQQVHTWYLAMYVDAVEWVEMPNTIGMSQFADGGFMSSKPYAATGKYIERMSPYCQGCKFNPAEKSGERACPFTTLYWDFLARHESLLTKNPRMALQVKNLTRLSDTERRAISQRAEEIRQDGFGHA